MKTAIDMLPYFVLALRLSGWKDVREGAPPLAPPAACDSAPQGITRNQRPCPWGVFTPVARPRSDSFHSWPVALFFQRGSYGSRHSCIVDRNNRLW